MSDYPIVIKMRESEIMSQSIATITFNPAIDLTGSLSDLHLNSVNRIEESDYHAAGKGVNVANVLSQLGTKVTVSGFLGRNNIQPFTSLFDQKNINNRFINISGNTRTNIKIIDRNHQVTEMNFPGFEVHSLDINNLEKMISKLSLHCDCFIISGSLPLGMAADQLGSIVDSLIQHNKRVYLDTSGEALRAGICSTPYFIKPNLDELIDLLGCAVDSTDAIVDAASSLNQSGIEHVVVSLGSEGLIWAHRGNVVQAIPPKVKVVSTVGAGDTLVAGFCEALEKADVDTPLTEKAMLAIAANATALSAANVQSVNVDLPEQNVIDALIREVKVRIIK